MTRPSTTYDAAIVGGGHNGLVAGFYLARAGLRVVIAERRDVVGGACVTEEFAPGFSASPGAYVLSMLRPAIWRDLRLVERGVVVDQSGPSLHVFPDGQEFELDGDVRRSTEAIRRLSPADARSFPLYEATLARIADGLAPLLDRVAPDPRVRGGRDLVALSSLGLLALRHRRDVTEAAFLFATSAARYLEEHFESEIVKSALGWESISNTLAGPSSLGTAMGLLHEAVSGGSGGGVGWGFVRGGMGALTHAMAEAATQAGAEIRTGTAVSRVMMHGDRATGIVLDDGTEIRARSVLSNADPPRTYLSLVGAEHLPESVAGAIRAYRCEGASMKINLGVAELPRLRRDRSKEIQPYHRGLVQITKPLSELDRDQAMAREGVPAPTAHIELCIPSVHDPTLAPDGQHVVTLGVRSQPYRLRDTTWDKKREAAADRAIVRLGEIFPNLPGAIVARDILSPLDLERRLALTGGHHLHGDMSPDQLFFLRPLRGYADYRTPIRGLYLCGAGTHPGGGVSGANGRNAAREVLRDVHHRRNT